MGTHNGLDPYLVSLGVISLLPLSLLVGKWICLGQHEHSIRYRRKKLEGMSFTDMSLFL